MSSQQSTNVFSSSGAEDTHATWSDVLSARGQSEDVEATLRPIVRLGSVSVADTRRGAVSAGVDAAPDPEDTFHIGAAREPMLRERYLAHRLIGSGGMAWVYRATQLSLRRRVAVKLLHDNSSRQHHELFMAEAQTLAVLEHPNIIPVYDAGDGWLAMKEIEGISFEEFLTRDFILEDAIEMLIKVVNAVAYAHKCGVVHRDIKAQNIMIGSFGEVWLVDWGLAVSVHRHANGMHIAPHANQADPRTGTPGCMPPEVAHGRSTAIRKELDVFLLGALLYRILGGTMPFVANDPLAAIKKAAAGDYLSLNQLADESSPRLIKLVEQAMSEFPHQRPTIDVFNESLRKWLRHSSLEKRAKEALAKAREAYIQARKLGRKEWDEAYVLYIDAIAAFEHVVNLLPDFAHIQHELDEALHDFASAALSVGNIFLARMLRAGHRPPKSGPPSSLEEHNIQ